MPSKKEGRSPFQQNYDLYRYSCYEVPHLCLYKEYRSVPAMSDNQVYGNGLSPMIRSCPRTPKAYVCHSSSGFQRYVGLFPIHQKGQRVREPCGVSLPYQSYRLPYTPCIAWQTYCPSLPESWMGQCLY